MKVVTREAIPDNSFTCMVAWEETKNPGKLAMRRPCLPDHVPFEVMGNYNPDGTVLVRVWVFPDPELV